MRDATGPADGSDKHVSMLRRIFPAVVAVSLCLATLVAQTQVLRGRVVGVADGDTITVLDASRVQHHIRLNGIDAPETAQPFAARAKQHLSDLVFGKDVTVVWTKRDRYDRIVGTVLVGTTSANLAQLMAGFAWYYRDYAEDVAAENRPLYEAAEAEARAARLGLWSDAAPQAPWIVRGERAAAPLTPRPLVSQPPAPTPSTRGRIIGNRNSGIYHAPGCPNYNDVAERNRVYFNTEAEAQRAGFRKARNC